MKTLKNKPSRLVYVLSLICTGSFCGDKFAFAQNTAVSPAITQVQLAALSPDEQDLSNFVRIQPACDTWDKQSRVLTDGFGLDEEFLPLLPSGPNIEHVSTLYRLLYTSDAVYSIRIVVRLADTPASAKHVLFDSSMRQTPFKHGTFDSPISIGDESWCSFDGGSKLLFRAGRVVVDLSGELSNDARNSGNYPQFPHAALEAVAYQIMLRAAQQPELTDVTPEQASVKINGHALPKNALMLGKQVYVPVAEFAKAMGLTSRWNAKTGVLTLSGAGHKTVTLTAGSTAAKVGGMAAAALKVPVLKQAGQPVMTLDDLLTLTGGRVTGRSGNTVQVKA